MSLLEETLLTVVYLSCCFTWSFSKFLVHNSALWAHFVLFPSVFCLAKFFINPQLLYFSLPLCFGTPCVLHLISWHILLKLFLEEFEGVKSLQMLNLVISPPDGWFYLQLWFLVKEEYIQFSILYTLAYRHLTVCTIFMKKSPVLQPRFNNTVP